MSVPVAASRMRTDAAGSLFAGCTFRPFAYAGPIRRQSVRSSSPLRKGGAAQISRKVGNPIQRLALMARLNGSLGSPQKDGQFTMRDFIFDMPGCLTVKVEADDEPAAKALVHRAFAHLNSVGVNLTSNVRLVAVDTAKDESSVRQKTTR